MGPDVRRRALRGLLQLALVLPFSATSGIIVARADMWADFGPEYFDATVYALAQFRGELVATGNFVKVGGRTVHHIARWDGESWQPLGGGLGWTDPSRDPSTVWGTSLLVHQDELYVGGNFDRAGAIEARHVARWDGERWHAVGQGFDAIVYDLEVYRNTLIACGAFRHAGPVFVANVAQYVGESWRIMEAGLSYPAYALHAHGGFLYAGGMFSGSSTGRLIERIGEWDGQTWRGILDRMEADDRKVPIPATVLEFASHGGRLVFAGLFDRIDGRDFNSVAVYDGVRVERPEFAASQPNLVHDRVLSLAVHQGDLIIGGLALGSAPPSMTNLARWDGSQYHEIGGGVNGWVQALLSTPEGLVVAGAFTRVGGANMPAIALWKPEPGIETPPVAEVAGVELEDVGGSAVRLRLTLAQGEPVFVDVYDLRGRRVIRMFEGRLAPGLTTLDWNGRDAHGRSVGRGRYQIMVGMGRSMTSLDWIRVR